eukprot:Lithocolla_globosa_v1_NODE_4370_length_1452_cov_41.826772.p1 type:complete len:378 gc:universal NODE_4370_length_1452_cov_41.826772:1317-184(-)
MLACHYSEPGAVPVVGKVDKPPSPGFGQLLVKIHSASLNPADWKSAEGEQAALLSFRWPRVYGFDFSGEVVDLGPPPEGKDSVTFSKGDRVFGMIKGLPQADNGTVAEYALVDSSICALCPSNASHVECASVPLVAITAVKAFRKCGLTETKSDNQKLGPRVFITGGAGGMGTIAIRLARCLFNASFIATTASAGAKTQLCEKIGANQVIDYKTQQFQDILLKQDRFDAILDCTGEADKCVPLLAEGGGLCSILKGPTAESLQNWLDESGLDSNNITIGVEPFLRSQWGGWIFQWFSGGTTLENACKKQGGSFHHVIGCGNGPIVRKIATLIESGEVKAVIDKIFVLKDSLEAIKYQKSGRAAGKVMIVMPCESLNE